MGNRGSSGGLTSHIEGELARELARRGKARPPRAAQLMSSDEEDEGVYAGVTLPQLGGGGAGPPPSDDEDDDEPSGEAGAPGESGSDDDAGASGLLGAEAAFDVDGSAYELNPFRAAGPVDQPDLPTDQGGGKGGKGGKGGSTRTLFIGGVPRGTKDAELLKAFVRYGKVQEASVARVDGQMNKTRGFGFVTFVSHKGLNYCLQSLGEPPQVELGGRACSVRRSEKRGVDLGGGTAYKLPARGSFDPRPRAEEKKGGGKRPSEWERPGELAAGGDDDGLGLEPPSFEGGDGYGGGGGGGARKKARGGSKGKGEIVTVTRREDAEPLYNKALTMKELFPKEFWKI